MYHSIDPSGSALSVHPADFREHVRWMASGSVRVVALPDLLQAGDEEDVLAVTFDDALESFGSVAAPLLIEAGIPATVFVVPDYVGRLADWNGTGGEAPVFPVLGWPELRELARAGVEIGSHSLKHPVLTRLSDELLQEEVVGSKKRIEDETGVLPRSFCYPYGAFDDRVASVAATSYEIAVTTELGPVSSVTHPFRVPRLEMYYFRDPRRLQSWGTPRFARYLLVRRLGRTARNALGGRPW